MDIKRWLFETGSPLEMRTARTLFELGMRVEQGVHYTDPDEPTVSREIDVVATCETPLRDTRPRGIFRMSCVIECKQAPTPWVLFRPPRSEFGTQPFVTRVASDLGAKWLASIKENDRLLDTPLWHLEDGPGYSLSTSDVPDQPSADQGPPSRSRKKAPPADLAYKAVYAVAKAATSLAAASSDASVNTVSVLFPVIVIKGQLFEAYLDGADLIVNEISRGKLRWSHPLAPDGQMLIDVITEAALPEFADDFVTAGRTALALGKEPALQTIEAMQPKVVLPRRLR